MAQLKCRPSREAEVRAEVGAAPEQAIQVSEYFHPRIEEVAAPLPSGLGRRLLSPGIMRRLVEPFLGPRKLRTDKFWTLWTMRRLASLRHRRRKTLGYEQEWTMIERWLGSVQAAQSTGLAQAIADCGQMVKGYGATRHRTTSRLMQILDEVEQGRVRTLQPFGGCSPRRWRAMIRNPLSKPWCRGSRTSVTPDVSIYPEIWQRYFPGVAVAAAAALVATFLSQRYGAPAMLLGLLLGMAFHFERRTPGGPAWSSRR